MTDWFLGTMGFSYKQWDGPFYPAGLAARQQLPYYAERFNAVEMDSTFYGTPRTTAVQRWAQATPPGFRICPKVPRQITHERRLHDATAEFEQFVMTLRLLGDRLGPILIQLPPDFAPAETAVLDAFLAQLPADLRFAVEFRHRDWVRPATADLLRRRSVCWASADYIHLPHFVTPTTDFLYLRFIGPHGQFATKDREMVDKTPVLQQWWQRLQPHLTGTPAQTGTTTQAGTTAVYAFFNNDYAGFSPATCNKFKRIVGLPLEESRPLQQGRLL